MLFSNEAVQLEHQPVQETSYFTAHEIRELMSLFQPSQTVSPVTSTCSEGSNCCGEKRYLHSNTNQSASQLNEKKRRRMISNRESARRCRWRRKVHLEDLNDQVKTLEQKNHELKNQLGWVLNRFYVLLRENDRLNSESSALLVRLSGLNNALAAMQRYQP